MNDDEWTYLQKRVDAAFERAREGVLGSILLDFAVIPKRSLYPALAKLLGFDCECRTLECRGCDEVEEWLMGLEDPEGMIARIVNAEDGE